MSVNLRALAAVLAVPLVALALTPNLGFYTLPGMLAMLLAAVLVVGTCLGRERSLTVSRQWASVLLYVPAVAAVGYLIWLTLHETSPLKVQLETVLAVIGALVVLLAYLAKARSTQPLQAAMIGIGVLLSGSSALIPQLRFGVPENPALSALTIGGLLACTVLMYLVWLSFLAQPQPAKRLRSWYARWGILLATGAILRVLAVVGSPEPVIDVHTWLTHAPRFLLEGVNPYPAHYPSPYGTERARRFHISDPAAEHIGAGGYAPGAILTGLPAALLGFDVRYINIAGDVLAAVLIVLVGAKFGCLEVGLLASALYLCLPRAAYMTEQSWYEPQLAALFGLFALWMPRRPWAAGVVLGGLFGLKQYIVMLVPAIWQACRGHGRVFWAAAALGAAIYLPFVLWDPPAFWQYALIGHLHWPTIYYSYIIAGLFKNEWGIVIPNSLMWGVSLVLVLALAWRAPRADRGPYVLWLGASMLVFNLCSTQGFPNYYYLVLFLLLLGVAQGEGRITTPASQSPPA